MPSLHVPDLAEQRGELVVVDLPGGEHLGVVVAEGPQLRQAAQQAGEVLGLPRVAQGARLPQHVQHGLLEPLHGRLVLHVGPLWGGGAGESVRRGAPHRTGLTGGSRLTWGQDGDGGEQSLLLLHHVELPDALVEVEHGRDELLRDACGGRGFHFSLRAGSRC